MQTFTLISVFFPIAAGFFLFFKKPESEKFRNRFTVFSVFLTAICIFITVIYTMNTGGSSTSITLHKFNDMLTLTFRLDMPSCIFALIIASLWPLTTI